MPHYKARPNDGTGPSYSVRASGGGGLLIGLSLIDWAGNTRLCQPHFEPVFRWTFSTSQIRSAGVQGEGCCGCRGRRPATGGPRRGVPRPRRRPPRPAGRRRPGPSPSEYVVVLPRPPFPRRSNPQNPFALPVRQNSRFLILNCARFVGLKPPRSARSFRPFRGGSKLPKLTSKHYLTQRSRRLSYHLHGILQVALNKKTSNHCCTANTVDTNGGLPIANIPVNGGFNKEYGLGGGELRLSVKRRWYKDELAETKDGTYLESLLEKANFRLRGATQHLNMT